MNSYSLSRNEQVIISMESLAALVEIFWGPAASHCPDLLGKRLTGLCEKSSSSAVGWADSLRELTEHVPSSQLDGFCSELESVYISLFINTRDGSTVPLYASCHEQGGELMGKPAAEMQTKLTAAGLALSGPSNEPLDHLAIQLEYLYFLLQDSLEDIQKGQFSEIADFARTGLLSWVPSFQSALESRASTSSTEQFYVAASSFLIQVLEQIVSWFSSTG